MKIGQEGDTRRFRKLRNTDFYASKAAFEASKREPKSFAKCKTCGQFITGLDSSGYCHRCHNEK